MIFDTNTLRLFVSQIFAIYFLLLLIPLKVPKRSNAMIIIISSIVITLINALIIARLGLPFYIRFYFLTLTLPHILLLFLFSSYNFSKSIFAVLTVQMMGNIAIVNGLLASYVFYGENNSLIDTLARAITYAIFLPILIKFIKPIFTKMAEILTNGWWTLNTALLVSYVLAYFILFFPDPVFNRPNYFIHAYIGLFLSVIIYLIMFFLFYEIKVKKDTEHDKELLSLQVDSLVLERAEITTIAFNDSLTGVKNRYSLFRRIDQLIETKQPFLVVFMDLDNLKDINDNYDHSRGDTYLKEFAQALKDVIKGKGEVFRFAGDEFIGLLTEDIDVFDQVYFKMEVAHRMPSDIPYYDMSLGLASFPKDGVSADELINLADQAMYAEKKHKKIRR